jgi:alpha-glucosidase (family GH31 glycosyl hydrolase)
MEYQFPNEGFEKIDDQFALGERIIVAPVIEKGAVERKVVLPKGKWLYLENREYDGGEVTVSAPISVLPYFVRKDT